MIYKRFFLLFALLRVSCFAQGNGLVVFGDSIGCGACAENRRDCSANGFGGQLAKQIPGKFVNYSRGGDMAPDMARLFVYPNANPGPGPNPIYITYIGNNDHNQYNHSLDEDHRKLFEEVDLASNAWLAIPSTFKVMAGSASLKKAGSWAADTAIPNIAALQSATQGSTLTFSIETGKGIYIGWRIIDDNGGAASIEIDGRHAADLLGYGPGKVKIHTINKTTDTIAVNRFAVSPGKHTIRIAVTSSTDPKNVFSFVWAGSYIPSDSYSAAPPPRVLIPGIIRMINDMSPVSAAAADQWVQHVASQLKQDGLNVSFVPVRDYVNATTDMFDGQHPNSIGHDHLREAFEKALKPQRDQ